MLLAVQTKVIQNRFRCNASDCNLNYLPLAATSVCTEDFNNSVGWQVHTHVHTYDVDARIRLNGL